jgi:hypothetical protein
VRSLSHARSKATQNQPAPPRDLEGREFKRAAAEFKTLEGRALESRPLETQPLETRTLDDLLREELQ